LLFRAARFADDAGETVVEERHVHQARDFLEQKAVESGIQALPTQKLLALMSVTRHVVSGDGDDVATTPIFDQYTTYAEREGVAVLSNRRFRDRLNDLADSNILNKRRGRGKGVENRYSLAIDVGTVIENPPKSNERLGQTADELRSLQ
jgi:cell division control protein 6